MKTYTADEVMVTRELRAMYIDMEKLLERLRRKQDHIDILADHMAEVKAIADGHTENTLVDVVDHCIEELTKLGLKGD